MVYLRNLEIALIFFNQTNSYLVFDYNEGTNLYCLYALGLHPILDFQDSKIDTQ